jgi:hypothetical protein
VGIRLDRRALLRAAAGAAAAALAPAGPAQNLSERELRAAYLFNFARFAEWPAISFGSPSAPIQACVFGATDPFDGALASYDGRMIGARPLKIRQAPSPAAAGDCHLLYVADSDAARLPVLRQAIGAFPALVIGESEALIDRGAMVAFRPADRRLAFVVNLAALRRADIRLPAQLLRLAAEVRE